LKLVDLTNPEVIPILTSAMLKQRSENTEVGTEVVPLKRLRKEKGLSPTELAARAGISAAQLHALEAERHSPTLVTAQRLAAVLGVGVDDLWPPAAEPVVAPVSGGAA